MGFAPRTSQYTTAQDWEGDDDRENPQNWSRRKQIYHMFIPAALGFIRYVRTAFRQPGSHSCSSYGTSSYSPAIDAVAKEFNVSKELAILPLSLYVLGLGLGPLISGSISETFGRRIVYLTCMPICLLFALGAGFSKGIAALAVCRFLSATAGAAPLAIGAGTIADIFVPHRRAAAISLWVLAPFLGPALGGSFPLGRAKTPLNL